MLDQNIKASDIRATNVTIKLQRSVFFRSIFSQNTKDIEPSEHLQLRLLMPKADCSEMMLFSIKIQSRSLITGEAISEFLV